MGGSVDVDMTRGRLSPVRESSRTSQPDVRATTTTTTTTSVGAGSTEDDSYMAKKMSHIMTNERAFKVLNRIEEKLAGTDRNGGGFVGGPGAKPIEVEDQVQYLIEEATKHENLAQGTLSWRLCARTDLADLDRLSQAIPWVGFRRGKVVTPSMRKADSSIVSLYQASRHPCFRYIRTLLHVSIRTLSIRSGDT